MSFIFLMPAVWHIIFWVSLQFSHKLHTTKESFKFPAHFNALHIVPHFTLTQTHNCFNCIVLVCIQYLNLVNPLTFDILKVTNKQTTILICCHSHFFSSIKCAFAKIKQQCHTIKMQQQPHTVCDKTYT